MTNEEAVRTVKLPTGEEITVYWSEGLQCWVTIPDDDEEEAV